MKTRSVTVRLPEDVIDFVNLWSGENFTDKLVKLLRAEMWRDVQDLDYLIFLDDFVHKKYRAAQQFNDLISASYGMILEFYKSGFVPDAARKYLQHLLEQLPSTDQDAIKPFGDLCPPAIYRFATAPARRGSGDCSQEERGIPQPCSLGEDMPRKPLDGSLTDHP